MKTVAGTTITTATTAQNQGLSANGVSSGELFPDRGPASSVPLSELSVPAPLLIVKGVDRVPYK